MKDWKQVFRNKPVSHALCLHLLLKFSDVEFWRVIVAVVGKKIVSSFANKFIFVPEN